MGHLKYHDHSPEFYKLLDAVIPGWGKEKLRRLLHGHHITEQ